MSSFGSTIKMKGEESYRQALTRINSGLRAMSSELKYASAEFSKNGSKVSDLSNKNAILKRKIEEETKAVELSKKAIKSHTSEKEKQKSTIEKLNVSIAKEKAELDKMKNSSNTSKEAIANQIAKINDLTKELNQAETAHNKAEKEVNFFKKALFDSKTAIAQSETEINKNNATMEKAKQITGNTNTTLKEMADAEKEVKTESENAGKGIFKLGDLIKANLLSDAIKAGIRGLADTIKGFASSVGTIGKTAVKEFASYEQLVGGVKTLFGDETAKEVEKFANNAYRTAGLSANQYMETVTGFSASLLQSLNGDTAKAAKVSDMAITDMADNANKMGTSMESIQNAYQGFAKQNYTMLDNLKLGYGGTKSEMERLLADAGKISKVKYDINNLNDVYQAIHVIQGELKITGATADEMDTTLEGAFKGLTGTWQNLIASLGKGNVDFSQLGNNLISSLGSIIKLIGPVITKLVNNLGQALPGLVANLVTNVLPLLSSSINTILQAMVDNLPVIINSISSLIGSILEVLNSNSQVICDVVVTAVLGLATIILDNLPKFIEVGINLIVSLMNGLTEKLPDMIPVIIDGVIKAVDSILDNIDKFIDAGIKLILALVDGLIKSMPKLIDKMPIIIDKLITALSNNMPKIVEGGITLIIKLASGLIKAIPHIIKAVPKIMKSLVEGIIKYYKKLFEMGGKLVKKVIDGFKEKGKKIGDQGKQLVEGLWNGIKDKTQWIVEKIKGFGADVLNAMKNIFGIKSPSKRMRDEVGVFLAQGIGVGFTEEMGKVNKQIQDAIPTEYDLASNVSVSSRINNSKGQALNHSDLMILNFQKALEGMAFNVDGDKMGEFVIRRVEKVVF